MSYTTIKTSIVKTKELINYLTSLITVVLETIQLWGELHELVYHNYHCHSCLSNGEK